MSVIASLVNERNEEVTLLTSTSASSFIWKDSSNKPFVPLAKNIKKAEPEAPKKRTVRVPLPDDKAIILLRWFLAHKDNPYPTNSEKEELAKAVNLDLVAVANWFSNCRRKFGLANVR